MSRTYRRKKKKPSDWVTHDYQRVSTGVSNCGRYRTGDWQYVPYTGKELKEQIAKWHTSDNHPGIHSVPSWYVNMYHTRKLRCQDRMTLKKMVKEQNFDDDHIFSRRRRSAGWDWW